MLCFAWKEKEKILGYIHTESPLDTAHRWWTEIRERSIYQHTQSSISRTTVFSPVDRDISLYNNNTTSWKKRKQTPRLTRTFSVHADQISQRTFRALRCPFARTKGFVSSIIKTLRFSPPQRSASGLFRQWRIVQSSLETSSLGSMRANTHTRKRECVLYAYCYQTMAILTRGTQPSSTVETDILWRWGGFWSRFHGEGGMDRKKKMEQEMEWKRR